MHRRRFLATLAGGAGASLAGCLVGAGGGPAGGATDAYDVGMGASVFRPAEVTVGVGEPVVWRNTNSRSHTVTAYEAQLPEGAAYFASGGYGGEAEARDAFARSFGGAMPSEAEYEHVFEVPGAYPYFCIPHERGGMVGRVVVRG